MKYSYAIIFLNYIKRTKYKDMRILIYDNNIEDIVYLHGLIQQLPLDIFIDKASDYLDEIALYSKHTYDIVFIDVIDDIGKKLLSYILSNNPKQKIISMTDASDCIHTTSCDLCLTDYNKSRFIKPINIQDIFNIFLENNKCNVGFCDNKLLLKLLLLNKRINSYTLNTDTLRFTKKTNYNISNVRDIVELAEQLTSLKINFKVETNYIQIQDVENT